MIDRTVDIKRLKHAVLVAGFCCLLVCGCNDNPTTHKVLGSVEFADGTKPKFGNVEFYSPELKINARGKINRDGTFTVSTFEDGDGAVAGSQKIVIMQQVGSYLLAKSKKVVNHDHGSLIDKKYLDYRTSDLSCEIEPGENHVHLMLKKLSRQTEDGMPRN